MKRGLNVIFSCMLVLLATLVYSCANRGSGPQGGPKDEAPPQVLKSNPPNGITNFQKKEINVDFNENIQLDKLNENVVISPPQKRNPEIVTYGKRLNVKFLDDFQENTTYTVNFGNAIVDLNERNALPNYRFSFSTGDNIDTLQISGYIINAADLNPISGIYVGIYDNTSDTVFLKEPFLRIGRTNEEGYFSIDNVKEGSYQLYALGDNNRDYFFQVGEGLAFLDTLVTPTFEWVEHRDTIWAADSISIDTVMLHAHNHFLPDNILMRYFKEDKTRQYFVKSERTRPEKFTLFFNTTLAELPKIEPLNFDWGNNYILQRNNSLDTLSFWLTDSLAFKQDTLQMAMTYFKTDSIFQLESTTDTINIIYRRPRAKGRRVEVTAPKVEPLVFNTNISSTVEIYNPVILRIDEPLVSYDTDKVHLSQKVDTILKPLQYSWESIDSTHMNYAIKHDWLPGISYQLEVDSAAFLSIYDKASNKYTGTFSIRKLEEYSQLTVVMTQFDPRAMIQLLDTKDAVISTKPALKEGTVFEHLKPTDYYLRLFIDENGNEKWDTGDLTTKRHPEEVFYYPYKLTLKANFEFMEQWDHTTTPLLKQKPSGIRQDAGKKQ